MFKIEIICDNETCEEHFILVSPQESIPAYCPYCSQPIKEQMEDEE